MKNLLVKEFKFSASVLTYIFLAASLMTFIPGYPILCGAFFFCLGMFYTFQSGRESEDVLFSALLPVKKSDVVRARYLFVTIMEMIMFMLTGIFTAVRMLLLSEANAYVTNPLMNANIMYLGFELLIYASFNIFMVGGFWKTAYKIGIPFLSAGIAIFVIIGVAETLHHIPGLEVLNSSTGLLSVQLSIFCASAIIYVVGTLISCRKSAMNFEKMDLIL